MCTNPVTNFVYAYVVDVSHTAGKGARRSKHADSLRGLRTDNNDAAIGKREDISTNARETPISLSSSKLYSDRSQSRNLRQSVE